MKITEGFVESQGHRLGYLSVNEHLPNQDDKPVVVFIHGVLVSVNFWRNCVPSSFKEDRHWYSLSLPAHHPSTVPAGFNAQQVNEQWFFDVMNGALKALLGDRKAIIVGHSTGGFCALNLAARHAPNVIGVVSVAGFHKGSWGGTEGLLLKLAGLGNWAKSLFVANLSLSRHSPLLQQFVASSLAYDKKAYRLNPLSQLMLNNTRFNMTQQHYADLFHLFNGISRIEIADKLSNISMPCYIFACTHDPIVSAKQSQLLSSKIPNAKTVEFHNVGHMPFIEDKNNYFNALEDAITSITQQTINNR